MTGALGVVGAALGDHLMPPRDGDNGKGFFEDLEVYEIHSKIFEQLGFTWDDLRVLPETRLDDAALKPHCDQLLELLRTRFLDQAIWAVKDPRVSLLVPLWARVLGRLGVTPHFVIMHRHPAEVAASLARRNGFSQEKSARLWLTYQLTAEASTRSFSRVFVSYEDLLANPVKELGLVAQEFDVAWPREAKLEEEKLRGFLLPELRHHEAGSEDRGFGRFDPWVLPYHRALTSMQGGTGEALRSSTDETLERLRAMESGPDELLAEHAAQLFYSLQGQLAKLETQLGALAETSEDGFKETARWLKIEEAERAKQAQLLAALEAQVDARTQWLQTQEEEGVRYKQSIRSIEEQLSERTEWLRIQSKSIESLRAEINRLMQLFKS
jgi:hypothetical protein